MKTETLLLILDSVASVVAIAGIACLTTLKKTQYPWVRPLKYPRPLETFFDENKCPNCGNSSGWGWCDLHDGPRDTLIQCPDCNSKFSINWLPHPTIEEIKR